jgi:hypothetical protein
MHDCVAIPCCQVIYGNKGVQNYQKRKKNQALQMKSEEGGTKERDHSVHGLGMKGRVHD